MNSILEIKTRIARLAKPAIITHMWAGFVSDDPTTCITTATLTCQAINPTHPGKNTARRSRYVSWRTPSINREKTTNIMGDSSRARENPTIPMAENISQVLLFSTIANQNATRPMNR